MVQTAPSVERNTSRCGPDCGRLQGPSRRSDPLLRIQPARLPVLVEARVDAVANGERPDGNDEEQNEKHCHGHSVPDLLY